MSLDLAAGSDFAGYRVERLVARGGMGAVYEAVERRTGERAALKLILSDLAGDTTFRRRFEREVRLSSEMHHPHVPRVLGAGDHDGVLYLATEFIEGSDLQVLILERERLHPQHAADVLSQVAGALDAAAQRGLIHRDVKPGNVLLADRQGRAHAYLTDFGLGKSVTSQSGLTRTGLWVGTADYASPEQIQSADVDRRTDVYSLGCVLFHALTGQLPYPRPREVAKLMAHISEPPPQPSAVRAELPPEFDAVIARAMAKAPDERFPTAGELGRAAVQAGAGLAPPAGPLISPGARPVTPVDRDAPTVA